MFFVLDLQYTVHKKVQQRGQGSFKPALEATAKKRFLGPTVASEAIDGAVPYTVLLYTKT